MFNLTGAPEQGHTSGQVVLDNIEHPHAVHDILVPLVSEARQKKTIERQSQYLHVNPGMAAAGAGVRRAACPGRRRPPPAPGRHGRAAAQAGELRDAGILTEEEFAAQKARVLAG